MQAGERCFLSLHKQQQRKNSESPWGIEPQTYEFCTMMLYHTATQPQRLYGEQGSLQSSCTTQVM